MSDTPALLPPDPDRPGRYWMTRTGWNIGKRVEIWEWSPSEPLWRHEQWGPMSPDLAGKAGYTLASPHPIPSAAALERLYVLLAKMEQQAVDYEDSMANGTLIHGHIKMLRDGLRAALEDK